jgi:hypothetical protein
MTNITNKTLGYGQTRVGTLMGLLVDILIASSKKSLKISKG